MEFSRFDTRKYRTLSVRDGYRQWVSTYEATVHDEMDLRLLERLSSVAWPTMGQAADLACGTGRIGAWLKARGVAEIDGVDLTPEMIEVARGKGIYRNLVIADVSHTGLPAGAYAGWVLAEMEEGVVGHAWLMKKPKWEQYRDWPVSFALAWRKGRAVRP